MCIRDSLYGLAKQAVSVAYSVAVQRQAKRRCAVQITGSQSPQPAVPEGSVADFLQIAESSAPLPEQPVHLISQPQAKHCLLYTSRCV